MRTRKRWIIVSFAMAVFFITIIGLRTNALAKDKLTVWMLPTYSADGNKMIKRYAKEYETQSNMKVDLNIMTYRVLREKVNAAIEAKTPPDLLLILGDNSKFYGARGLLVDMKDMVEELGKQGGGIFESSTLPLLTDEKGNVWGMPMEIDLSPLYARKDILQKGGMDFPTTWDEFREISKKLQKPPLLHGAGLTMGRTPDGHHHVLDVIWAYGGRETKSDGKTVAINSPETAKAVQLIADMFLKDKSIPKDSLTWQGPGNNQAYQTKRLIFTINPGSIYSWLSKNDPELLNNTAMLRLPKGPSGTQFAWGGCWAWLLFKSNDKKHDLARGFLRYIYDLERYNKLIIATGGRWFPIYRDLAEDPFWKQDHFKNFPQLAADTRFIGFDGPPNEAAAEVQRTYILMDMIHRIVVENWDTQKALDEAEKRMNEVHARYK